MKWTLCYVAIITLLFSFSSSTHAVSNVPDVAPMENKGKLIKMAQFIDPRNQSKRGVKPLPKPTLKQAPTLLLLELDAADCKRELSKLLDSTSVRINHAEITATEGVSGSINLMKAALDDFAEQFGQNTHILDTQGKPRIPDDSLANYLFGGGGSMAGSPDHPNWVDLITQNMLRLDGVYPELIQKLDVFTSETVKINVLIHRFFNAGKCGVAW